MPRRDQRRAGALVTPVADNGDAAPDAVFAALADPTRRTILQAVAADGPLTATTLAMRLPVTRQAVSKHLQVLRDAGLVESRRIGRETRFQATTRPLLDARQWLARTQNAWDQRLARLTARAGDG